MDKSVDPHCSKDALTGVFGWFLQFILASLAFTCLICKLFYNYYFLIHNYLYVLNKYYNNKSVIYKSKIVYIIYSNQ